ncbi:glycogen synthase GlgA [Candidatus Xianfuyuplasma coldseepsis]|uniref:Glycogen synthase n=1 Tax=Candidatus Xianfuyuplasma coldseepsis TaxID=2782163 RepID=A0A7L7KSY5_9MOLU|nr:glycogen synthase GlgA [Xianfuyuplasma coldseepsis]QMS85817.1 glycogen synthase GlgA [Xianfuyuplasma coldseepsis]
MKVLFVGSEATPFSKTGGLADVLGSLPKALTSLGVDARVVVPKHMWTKEKYHDLLEPVCHYRVVVGPKKEYAGIEKTVYDGVTFYFVDNEYYFGYRNTLYGHYDDGERYGFFNNAVLQMLAEIDFYPDIIHCNDWQSGLIPYLLQQKYRNKQKYASIKTIMTIHNIAYQGRFSKELMPYLDVEYSSALEFENVINFLKCGIVTADYVTTVSETYANEILYDYFGYGMHSVLRERTDRLRGIVNGVDYDVFNPKVDSKIFYNYSLYNYVKGKRTNKETLREYYQLARNKRPMIGMVSRLTEAKGFDLVMEVLEPLIANDEIQFVLLGSGDYAIEEYFNNLRLNYPEQVGVYIGYNDEMARKIYAGVDMFLMPSRFEPCGLAQLISLKYGTVPIVRKTGGLRDTIEIYNKYTGEGTGFGFENYDAGDMLYAINNALEVYGDQRSWKDLVKRCMEQDFSWEESAKKYITLYHDVKEI